jgi:NADH-quinone oxidoreductase subunit K
MFMHFLASVLLLVIGICGVFLSRKNVILSIMCLEIMLLAVNFLLIFFSTFWDDAVGFMFMLFVLAVGASESAIGLALVITYYRHAAVNK